MGAERDTLWQPPADLIADAALTRYAQWLSEAGIGRFPTYGDLWRWSVDDIERFWTSIWEFFDVPGSRSPGPVLASRSMPGARWFEGSTLNYAEVALAGRHADDAPAIECYSRGRRDALVVARGAHRGGRSRRGGPAPARGRARGPRRGVPPDRARGGDRVPRHREHRRRVVVLLTRLRPASRGRPVRTDRADGAARRRRLPIWRPLVRSARGARRDRGRAARRLGGV